MDLKKHLLRALLLCLLMMCVIGAALAEDSDGFLFERSGDAWAVVGYQGSAAEIRVPDWHEGLPVTRIGPSAFEGNQTLTTLILPSSITRIGAGAFRNCSRLTTISTYTAHSTHEWDEGEMLIAPTCQQDGEIRYACSVCQATRDEVLPASDEYHVWGEGVITTPATCKDEGVLTFVCTVCQAEKTEPIPVTDEHVWGEGVITVPATCKDEGVMTFVCTVCQAEKTEPIPVTDEHVWGEGVVTQEPTETEDGVMTYTCTVCQATKTEPIPATGKEDPIRVPGDANEDGGVDMRDAMQIMRWLAGWDVTINESNADVNADGGVDMRDAMQIMRWLAGWDVVLQ